MSLRSILLVGATGVFGSRLAKGLAGLDGVTLLLSSREAARAERLAATLSADARTPILGLAFDHRSDLARLSDLRPWLVIDASGPFQLGSYALARASLEAGAHFIDLADARQYLLEFPSALDSLARSAGLSAIAGASSTPALSAAAAEALTSGWRRVDSIDIAILPAGASEVGKSVLEAVLSYVGRPVPAFRDGRLETCLGWGRLEPLKAPGLRQRWVSPVETADAELLAMRLGVRSRVTFRAGLESRLEQLGLWAISRVFRAWRPSAFLSTLLHAGRRLTRARAGSTGAMIVRAAGLDADGAPSRAQWSLLAKNNEGLFVPTLAALAATRALLTARIAPGATICIGVVDLTAIEREMRPHAIATRQDVLASPQANLFRTALGDDVYLTLPPALLAFHDPASPPVWSGAADVDAGSNLFARFARWLFGLPGAARDCPVRVSVERDEIGTGGRMTPQETWARDFGERRFSSRLRQNGAKCVVESFGPFAFDLLLTVEDQSVAMPLTGWRLFGLPLPRALAPRSVSREFQKTDGRYGFDIKLSMPLIGLIVHYRGWLEPRP